jgi:hypothetical protein
MPRRGSVAGSVDVERGPSTHDDMYTPGLTISSGLEAMRFLPDDAAQGATH